MSTTTNPALPTSNAAVGTGIGDGTTYGAWSSPQRLHNGSVGSSATVATSAGKGTVWTGCFSSGDIPSGATVLGVEIVAGDDSDGSGVGYIGNAGSTGASESSTLQLFLYNGTSYSSALVFTHALGSGITLNGDSDELTVTGANKKYANDDSNVDSLAGASDSLSGLSWSPSDQASWGFAITLKAVSATPVAVALRGLGLRVTYASFYSNTVLGIAPSNILKVTGIATANVINRSMPGNTSEPLYPDPGVLYQFESETTAENVDWVPGNNWVNGSSAVDGTYWGRTSNKTVTGWRVGVDSTPSGTTGPDGGVDISDGSHVTSNSNDNYLFTEASSNANLKAFVTRTPVINSNNMSYTGNDLNLKFWVHAFGSGMGDLYVYIAGTTTSNHSSATELAAYESFSGFTAQSSVWQQKTISLNSYRNGVDYYIYFVSQNGTSFRSDMSIDAVQIIES